MNGHGPFPPVHHASLKALDDLDRSSPWESARILALASINDPATLDAATIRTGRFDAIVDVSYPTRADAARIFTALLDGLLGAEDVHPGPVVAALPEQTSGSPDSDLFDAFDAITEDVERVSALTCERCGQPATPRSTRYRVKALCDSCADTRES